jgi:hypothetical protein
MISHLWILNFAAVLGVAIGSTGIHADALPRPQPLTGTAAAEAVALVKAPETFDLSKIYVLRLKVEGKAMEVTSLGPSILSGKPGVSFTAGVFAADRKTVVFISRSATGQVSRLDMPTTELEAKHPFHLFLDAPNSPEREVDVEVTSLLTKP